MNKRIISPHSIIESPIFGRLVTWTTCGRAVDKIPRIRGKNRGCGGNAVKKKNASNRRFPVAKTFESRHYPSRSSRNTYPREQSVRRRRRRRCGPEGDEEGFPRKHPERPSPRTRAPRR